MARAVLERQSPPEWIDSETEQGDQGTGEHPDAFAPDGPDDVISIRPSTPGYRGLSQRVWWAVLGSIFVIVVAFAWGAGLFRNHSAADAGAIGAQGAPAPIATTLPFTAGRSDALPISATQVPLRHGRTGTSAQSTLLGQEVSPAPTATPGFAVQLQRGAAIVQPPVPNPQIHFGTIAASGTGVNGGYVDPNAQPNLAVQQALTQQQQAAGASLIVTGSTQSVANAANSATPAPTGASIYSGDGQQGDSQVQVPTYSVWPGDVVPAMLDTGIVSDVPGPVLAHVTQDVYDSLSGKELVIPRGSRLIGQYSSAVSSSQTRMGIDWQMLVMPNGHEVDLSGLSAADLAGNPGLPASVNTHRGRILETTLILGGIAGLSQLANPQQATTSGGFSQPSVLSTIANAQAQQLVNSGSQMIQRDQAIAPTLTVPRNTPFNIILSKRMSLPAYSSAQPQE